jgi:hypothetical protein
MREMIRRLPRRQRRRAVWSFVAMVIATVVGVAGGILSITEVITGIWPGVVLALAVLSAGVMLLLIRGSRTDTTNSPAPGEDAPNK